MTFYFRPVTIERELVVREEGQEEKEKDRFRLSVGVVVKDGEESQVQNRLFYDMEEG